MNARPALLAALVCACLRSRPAPDAHRAQPAPSPTPSTSPAAAPPTAGPRVDALPPEEPSPVRYVIRVTGGAAEGDRLPLVVALHGLGDSPEAFVQLFTSMNLRARIAAPAGLDRWGDGWSWFPSRAGTPRERWVGGIRRAADAVVPSIRALTRRHPTCGLPLVTGFSQGGMLSYAIVARPDGGVFAAMPVAGLLPRELWPEQRPVGGLLPGVYALHGDADARVPVEDDRAANRAFRDAGFHAELREYPGVDHTVTTAMARDLRARLVEVSRGQGCPLDGSS